MRASAMTTGGGEDASNGCVAASLAIAIDAVSTEASAEASSLGGTSGRSSPPAPQALAASDKPTSPDTARQRQEAQSIIARFACRQFSASCNSRWLCEQEAESHERDAVHVERRPSGPVSRAWSRKSLRKRRSPNAKQETTARFELGSSQEQDRPAKPLPLPPSCKKGPQRVQSKIRLMRTMIQFNTKQIRKIRHLRITENSRFDSNIYLASNCNGREPPILSQLYNFGCLRSGHKHTVDAC